MKRILAWLTFLLLMFVAVGTWAFRQWASRPPGDAFFQRPSGDLVRFRAATWGTRHLEPERFPLEHRSPDWVRDAVARLAGQTWGSPMLITNAQPRLVVWTQLQPAPTAGPTTGPAPTGTLPGWVNLDAWLGTWSHGGVEPLLRGKRQSVMWMPGRSLVGIEFDTYPRDAEFLALVIGMGRPDGSFQQEGTLVFRNPHRLATPAPAWQLDHLPAEKSEAGLRCVLESVHVGRRDEHFGAGQPPRRPVPTQGTNAAGSLVSWDQAEAQIEFRMVPPPDSPDLWTFGGLELSDAFGNVCRPTTTSTSTAGLGAKGQRVTLRWSPVLWDSAPWQLAIETKRAGGSRLPPADLAVFEDVPLPEGIGTNRIDRTLERHGIRITLAQVVRKEPGDQAGWSSADVSRVDLRLAGLRPDVAVDLLRLSDESGKELTSGSSSTQDEGKPGERQVQYHFLAFPEAARKLRIEVAAQPMPVFRFRIDPLPTDSATNATTKSTGPSGPSQGP